MVSPLIVFQHPHSYLQGWCSVCLSASLLGGKPQAQVAVFNLLVHELSKIDCIFNLGKSPNCVLNVSCLSHWQRYRNDQCLVDVGNCFGVQYASLRRYVSWTVVRFPLFGDLCSLWVRSDRVSSWFRLKVAVGNNFQSFDILGVVHEMVSSHNQRQDVRMPNNLRPNADAISITMLVACVLHTYAAAWKYLFAWLIFLHSWFAT
jgi:hypothetical protein